jgi:hypothetical protein
LTLTGATPIVPVKEPRRNAPMFNPLKPLFQAISKAVAWVFSPKGHAFLDSVIAEAEDVAINHMDIVREIAEATGSNTVEATRIEWLTKEQAGEVLGIIHIFGLPVMLPDGYSPFRKTG